MTDLVIVSMHEKGFPQGDLYIDCGDMPIEEFNELGAVPDGWFSLNKGMTLEDARAEATKRYPGAKIVDAEDEDDDEDDSEDS